MSSIQLCFLLLIIISSTILSSTAFSFLTIFKCVNNQCQRINKPIESIDLNSMTTNNEHMSLSACRLICGSHGGLWPIPTGFISINKSYIPIHYDDIEFVNDNIEEFIKPFLNEISQIFIKNLHQMCKNNCYKDNSMVKKPVIIRFDIKSQRLKLNWNTKEDYNLKILTLNQLIIDVLISGTSVFGIRHGLETLLQLFAIIPIINSDKKQLIMINSAKIDDKPIYKHRGLLIDTARNYLSISTIKKTIDGLAACKMNVLHWHITDSQSFPLQLQSRPIMSTFGAYSRDMIYTLKNISNIVNYAKLRGVRIILELDSPSHAGAGWDWGPIYGLGNLAVCVNQEPWRDYCIQPPCGQLNPVNPNTFHVLKDIYYDVMAHLDSNSVIHLGGDEVYIGCWNSTMEIVSAMKNRSMGRSFNDFLQLWSEFHAKQLEILDEVKKEKKSKYILWSSGLTSPDVIHKYVDKSRFIIQTWVESSSFIPNDLLDKGYQLIISTKNAWYLDHGFWGVTKYYTWRNVYENQLPKHDLVLGGEVCMWGEYVNDGSFMPRVWPRTAAAGERLWSDSPVLTTGDVEPRFQGFIDKLKNIYNVDSDAITPGWCDQHAKKCF